MAGNRRGPAPESASVKKMKGNPGKRPIKTADDEQRLEALDVDSQMSGPDGYSPPDYVTGEGVDVWNRLVPNLRHMRLLTAIDRDTFGRYCQNFGMWIRAQNSLVEDGATYRCNSQHGSYIKLNPSFTIASRLERELQSTESKFGLNPADRQRLFVGRAGGQGANDLFDKPSDGVGGGTVPDRPVGFLN